MLSEIEVANKLVEINAIKLSPDKPFTWASGLHSPIYCDNRKVLSYASFRTDIKRSLAKKCLEFDHFNKVAGVATAGIAHGALIADELELPFIYVRSKPKAHGTKSQIEGDFSEGERCVVVEDLISTGGSSIQAVEVLRDQGLIVVGVIAIFSYAFDQARENFEKANCPFATLSDYHSLLKAMEQRDNLTSHQLRSLGQWREDPKQWSLQHKRKQEN